MSIDEFAVTLDELSDAINYFVTNECQETGNHLIHKDCGGGIRKGFLNLFYFNDDGSLHPGLDGFGIGKKSVPYCEKCFPPNGPNYTYAIRFPILREGKSDGEKNNDFIWGNRELKIGDRKLLLK
jgi:hypothetical protein